MQHKCTLEMGTYFQQEANISPEIGQFLLKHPWSPTSPQAQVWMRITRRIYKRGKSFPSKAKMNLGFSGLLRQTFYQRFPCKVNLGSRRKIALFWARSERDWQTFLTGQGWTKLRHFQKDSSTVTDVSLLAPFFVGLCELTSMDRKWQKSF